MAGMLDVLLNFCIRLVLLIPVFLIFKVPVSSSILLFPVGSVALILVGLCFGLLLTVPVMLSQIRPQIAATPATLAPHGSAEFFCRRTPTCLT